MRKRLRYSALVGAGLTAASLSACANDSTSDLGTPDKHGIVVAVPLRGADAAKSENFVRGVKLALKQKSGGFAGHSLRLNIVDSTFVDEDGEQVVGDAAISDAAGTLVGDKSALAVIGGGDPDMSGALLRFSDQQRTAFVAGFGDQPEASIDLTGRTQLGSSNKLAAAQLVKRTVRSGCSRRLALVFDGGLETESDSYTALQTYKKVFGQRKFKVLSVGFNSDFKQFRLVLRERLQVNNPNCVVVAAEPISGDLGHKLKWLSQLIKLPVNVSRGTVSGPASGLIRTDKQLYGKATKELIRLHKQWYKSSPSSEAVAGWNAMQTVVEAAERSGDNVVSRNAVRDELQQIVNESATNPLQIDPRFSGDFGGNLHE